MCVIKAIASLGKFVGKGDVKCSACAHLDKEKKCYGVPMKNVNKPMACLFYKAKK